MAKVQRPSWASLRRRLHPVGLVVGGGLLLYQLALALQSLWSGDVLPVRPLGLAASFLLALATNALLTGGWLAIMRQLGVGLTTRQALTGYSLSFLPRYIPGSIWGYLSRNEWLRQQHQVSLSVANWGSVFEIVAILLTGAVASCIYWAASFDTVAIWVALACTLGLGVSVGVVRVRAANSARIKRLLARFGLPTTEAGVGATLKLLLVYLALWLCHGGALFALGKTFLGINPISPAAFVFAYYVAWTAGFLALFVPAGLGIRETTLAGLLVGVVGLSPTQAVVVAVLSRVVALAAEITWVGVTIAIHKLQIRAEFPP